MWRPQIRKSSSGPQTSKQGKGNVGPRTTAANLQILLFLKGKNVQQFRYRNRDNALRFKGVVIGLFFLFPKTANNLRFSKKRCSSFQQHKKAKNNHNTKIDHVNFNHKNI
ncbi:unnamed protein product [Lathyrus sativus]|nr:unnamed protein product [Lathyrus sativus]